MYRQSGKQRGAFTLVELMVIVAVIALLLGLLLPAVQSARDAARRTVCSNQLRQIGIAFNTFHTSNGQFPAGSDVAPRDIGLSWRVHLLPFLDQTSIYEVIDPSVGPNGTKAGWAYANSELPIFHCPSQSNATSNRADYSGVMGAGTTWAVTQDKTRCGSYATDGLLYPDSAVSGAHIKDGHSKTMATGERSYFVRNSWLYGSAWSEAPAKRTCVYSCKNVVWPLNSQGGDVGYFVADPEAEKPFRTIVMNDLMFGSEHRGGAFFQFVDGSVHFIDDSIDFTIYQELATIAGGEVSRFPD